MLLLTGFLSKMSSILCFARPFSDHPNTEHHSAFVCWFPPAKQITKSFFFPPIHFASCHLAISSAIPDGKPTMIRLIFLVAPNTAFIWSHLRVSIMDTAVPITLSDLFQSLTAGQEYTDMFVGTFTNEKSEGAAFTLLTKCFCWMTGSIHPVLLSET